MTFIGRTPLIGKASIPAACTAASTKILIGAALAIGTALNSGPNGDLSVTHAFLGGDCGEVEANPGSLPRML
jgi:hypothetical protein